MLKPSLGEFRQTRRKSELESWNIERKIGVVKRIVEQFRGPGFLHVVGSAKKFGLFFFRSPMPSGGRFVMNQVRVRRPNDAIAAARQAQTEIDVVKTDAKIFFIKASELGEDRFSNSQARASNRRAILLEHGA